VEYEDRITIWAPEGLALEYTLAGLGSRFIAELVDVGLRVLVLGAVIGVLAAAGARGTALIIVLIVGAFLALFAYDIAFEMWAAGRTPGKRWNGLRVLMASGQPVTFGASAVRNVMRIIDMWGTAMLAGTVSIVLTKRGQRLGDLAGGTIVVRERRASERRARGAAPEPAVRVPIAGQDDVDVTAVSAAELSAIRDFLGRRQQLTPAARARVAAALADGVRGKVGGLPPGGYTPEELLQVIVAAKGSSGPEAGPRYGSEPPSQG
jgi:uncharacterized RDD family membrane protein YckC